MDWKVIVALVASPMFSALLAWLIASKRVKSIRAGKFALELTGADTTLEGFEGFLIEILLETSHIAKEVRKLTERRRREIRRYVVEWRDLMSQHIREGFEVKGFKLGELYRNVAFRYVHKVLDDLRGKIIGMAMDHCEQNGFEELITESDREVYCQVRATEITVLIRTFIDREFIISDNSAITQEEMMEWMQANEDRLRDVWVRLYRSLVSLTVAEKSELMSRGERIVAKGTGILSEARLDQLRVVLTHELLEGI